MVGKEEEEGRRKKPRKKPLRRDWDLNPWTLSPEPSVLSIRPRRPAHYNKLSGTRGDSTAVAFSLHAQPARVRFRGVSEIFQKEKIIQCCWDLMTASLLRWWTVQGLIVIRTHPVQVRAVLQKKILAHDVVRSVYLWCRKRPLCQLRHSHGPRESRT